MLEVLVKKASANLIEVVVKYVGAEKGKESAHNNGFKIADPFVRL